MSNLNSHLQETLMATNDIMGEAKLAKSDARLVQ